ncbi:hypothetical protein GCM10020256_63600 [Streptomyces thermocoprophilus]
MPAVQVVDAEAGEDVTGEGVPAEHHPGPAPDRHDGADTAPGFRQGLPGALRLLQPAGPGARPARRDDPVEFAEGLRHRADLGDQHLQAGAAQLGEVGGAVLLLVGEDEVGGEADDALQVGVLGAADTGDVEAGGVAAPVGGADEDAGRRGGDRLGERRHQGDDPHGRGRSRTASMCSATATTISRVSETVARQRCRTPPVR